MYKQSRAGFTIVELLIVIVVIAILAAISIVAYNGIQSRANDSAIQSDLASFGKQLLLAEVDGGQPPAGGAVRSGGSDTGTNTAFPGITFKPSKGAYIENQNNLYYCTGVNSSGNRTFRILARSKSGTTFEYISSGSVSSIGPVALSSTECLQQPYNNTGSWTYGYRAAGTWNNWAQ